MKSFEVNTHHAYLNTDIILKSSGVACEVHDQMTGATYMVDSVLNIKLCAGEHILRCAETDQSEVIVIEDAIKLGGSEFKPNASFVSEITPWIAVTMKDRIYFYNRDTKAEFVEHNLSPASVKYIGGKANEYFLFRTEDDYSIFNACTRQVTYNCKNVIYTNNHLVISEEQSVLTVYDYVSDVFILQSKVQYSIYESSLFYVCKNNYISKLDLINNETSQIKSVLRTNTYLFSGKYALVYVANYGAKLRYELIDLSLDVRNTMDMDYFISSFCGVTFSVHQEIMDGFDAVITKNIDELFSYHMSLNISVYNIIGFEMIDSKDILKAELVTKEYKNKRLTISYQYFRLNVSSYIDCRDAIEVDASKRKVLEEKTPFKINSGELICYSDSENMYISLNDGKLYETHIQDNSCTVILKSIFDCKKYMNAYFSSDGSSIIALNRDKTADLLGFKDLSESKFDTANSTVYFTGDYGVNGYKPELNISDGRKPIWRDPVTLNFVRDDDRVKCVFKSPDGKYIADNDHKVVYHNTISNSDITNEEYNALHKRFDWDNPTEEERKQKVELRQQFALENPDYKGLSECKDGNYTQIFVKELYYAYYRKSGDPTYYRVLIGENVWYLNYISFSYDSRYMAIAVRYKNNSGKGGECLIYDLEKEMLIFTTGSIDITQNIYAVWMAMFTPNNTVAFYSSNPCAYMLNVNLENPYPTQILGRSLLCFSRSGRYVAFSNQGYIAYNNGRNSNWGHQPSGNVYIHSTYDPTAELEHYSDLGEHIKGVAYRNKNSRKGNVASAAFSTDEKRFLVVGDDGVIVVRNLKAAKAINTKSDDTIDLPF